MTDDAAKPDDARTKSPAQLPPIPAPPPAESLETDAIDTSLPPPAYEPAENSVQPANPVPATAQRGSRGLAVVLALVCVLVLVGAGYLYWLSREAALTIADRLNGLDQAVTALDQRLAAVEKRPIPAPVDLRPLDQRLTALERKPANQLDANGQAEIAGLAGRIDQLLARQDQLGQREQADIGKLGDQLAAQDTRIAAQDGRITTASQAGSAAGGQVDALVARERRLASLQSASGALAAGRPLGAVPGAPPALAQFADKAPPTEAALRLSFGDAARAAHEAGMPAKEDAPFLSRVWARMQSSVTIRQGDHVVVGDAVSDILAKAQSLLDAGDLAGAVTALGDLSGPAAAAMAPWRARAQSLLDARAALLALARG
jgi:hypothetical protein